MRSRWLAWVALVTGCGRISFDPRADAGPDGTPPPGPVSFAALCADMRLTIIQDGSNVDDPQAMTAAMTIATSCNTTPVVSTVMQSDAGVLDSTTNEPLLLPTEVGVLGGGNVPQLALRYLGPNGMPLILSGPGGFVTIVVRASGATIVDLGPITPTHDYGIIQIIRDANTGTRYLSLFGPGGQGTIASGFWFANRFAVMLATDRNSWYVVEWADADATGNISAGDTYTVVGSG